MGIFNFYLFIGFFVVGWMFDWIGCWFIVVVVVVLFFVGVLFMGFVGGYVMLMLGCFVVGVGVGYGLMIVLVYIVEVFFVLVCGFFIFFFEVFINVGIFFGYVFNYVFVCLLFCFGWCVMFGIGVVLFVLLVFMVFGMFEFFCWFVMKGCFVDVSVVLDKIVEMLEEVVECLVDIKVVVGIFCEGVDGDVVVVVKSKSVEESWVWKELILFLMLIVWCILFVMFGF